MYARHGLELGIVVSRSWKELGSMFWYPMDNRTNVLHSLSDGWYVPVRIGHKQTHREFSRSWNKTEASSV